MVVWSKKFHSTAVCRFACRPAASQPPPGQASSSSQQTPPKDTQFRDHYHLLCVIEGHNSSREAGERQRVCYKFSKKSYLVMYVHIFETIFATENKTALYNVVISLLVLFKEVMGFYFNIYCVCILHVVGIT